MINHCLILNTRSIARVAAFFPPTMGSTHVSGLAAPLLERGLNGVGPGDLPPSPLWYSLMAAFIAVAMYNAIEIHVQVFAVFKHRRGLYFWSILVTACGIVLLSVGNIALKLMTPGVNFAFYSTFVCMGWWMVVLGQATVLYSRLHLVVRSRTIMRAVPIMIGCVFFGFCIPTSIATYGSNSDASAYWLPIFNRIERVQLLVIELQETIISGIYIWATAKILRPSFNPQTKRVMWSLININAFVVALDIVMITMEFLNYYDLEASLKPMLYSVKLKVEFAVLNQLMAIAKAGISSAGYDGYNTADPNAFGDGKTAKGLWSVQSSHKWIPSFGNRHRHRGQQNISNGDDSAITKTQEVDVDISSEQKTSKPLAWQDQGTTSEVTAAGPRRDDTGSDKSRSGVDTASDPDDVEAPHQKQGQPESSREKPPAAPPAAKLKKSAPDSTDSTDESWLELENMQGQKDPIEGEQVLNRMGMTLEDGHHRIAAQQRKRQQGLDMDPWDDVIGQASRTGQQTEPYVGPRGSNGPSARWEHVEAEDGDRWEPRRERLSAGESATRPGLIGGRRRHSVSDFGIGHALDEVADDEIGLTLFPRQDEDKDPRNIP